MSAVILWAIVCLYALSSAVTVARVGKTSDPMTGPVAVFSVALNIAIVLAIVTHWDAS